MKLLLSKGMFGKDQFSCPNGKLRFNICTGQYRYTNKMYHNAGWYNKLGEKLGWGDLDKKDLDKISNGLTEDELFIILGERDSFWNFVTGYGMIGSMCTTKPDVDNPGIDYVVEHAIAYIEKGNIVTFPICCNSSQKELLLKKCLEK